MRTPRRGQSNPREDQQPFYESASYRMLIRRLEVADRLLRHPGEIHIAS
jgi:hypothetical protein